MSIYNVNGQIISQCYNSEGEPLQKAYDINGNVVTDAIFDDSTTITDVYSMSTTESPQGGCIDDDGNIYVCFYAAGVFLKYNINTGTKTETSFTPNAYGHANGMTYNPYDGYLYLAAMKNTGEVYVFDKSFNLVKTLYAKDGSGTAFNCWNIAYDRITQKFITITAKNKMFFFDNNFDYLSDVPCDKNALFPYTAQDIETDGEYVYAVGWQPNTIGVASMDGSLVKLISNRAFIGEPESMCYDWMNGVYYIEGNGFVIRRAVFKH